MRRIVLSFLIVTLSLSYVHSEEGMWIPMLLKKYNIEEMQKMGFKLSAEDVYDINHASLKDAIVIFGRGCTGELISKDGLLITNHHCGYRQIQSHSSLENDYLTNGFWAMNRSEELVNKGLSVKFLQYMKDVTPQVLVDTDNLQDVEREKKIKENIRVLEIQLSESGKYAVKVKPLFNGNQYFAYVYKEYKDVRLVGAPPSAIGKFGGDTDNWMWPRHTGDFSVFRVYADKNNEPADYSPDNVPYQPKKHLKISLQGVQPNDFTLVFGYPGTTMQYLPHQEVDLIMNVRDPNRIALRDKKLDILTVDMEANPQVRIQYAAKAASISNAWKKWQGEIKGLKRLNAVQKKKDYEQAFKEWAQKNGKWESTYLSVFENFDHLYKEYVPYITAADYYSEIVTRGVEVFRLASHVLKMVNKVEEGKVIDFDQLKNDEKNYFVRFYKDFNQPTDEQLFSTLLPILKKDIQPQFLPDLVVNKMSKCTPQSMLENIYRKSALPNKAKMLQLFEKGDEKAILELKNDPIVKLYGALKETYNTKISPVTDSLYTLINQNKKQYMKGIMEMRKNQRIYPDANFTMRVAYGKVEGYQPRDGVTYNHQTTLEGIIEKDNPEIYDYDVPDKLKELYLSKNYGQYGVNGTMPVCFLASNHTTGGNSGSPVLNAEGNLVGVNFDRCWEGTMSDIMFDPERCRNIILDIRYALFIIDKFAGAGYLVEEMDLVK